MMLCRRGRDDRRDGGYRDRDRSRDRGRGRLAPGVLSALLRQTLYLAPASQQPRVAEGLVSPAQAASWAGPQHDLCQHKTDSQDRLGGAWQRHMPSLQSKGLNRDAYGLFGVLKPGVSPLAGTGRTIVGAASVRPAQSGVLALLPGLPRSRVSPQSPRPMLDMGCAAQKVRPCVLRTSKRSSYHQDPTWKCC